MPSKCYVVEVHIVAPGGMNHPGKVAQSVLWQLTGATVPGARIIECTGRNCTCQEHQALAADWPERPVTRLAPESPQAQR